MLSRGFWLGKCEVTQGEYRQIVDDNPSLILERAAMVPGVAVDKLPVENVSWDAAVEFCRRLTEQEHKAGRLPPDWAYRLPTEAQWEYACRAGVQMAYHFGGDESCAGDFAWYGDNSQDQEHEVGQKPPNAWGLHDMHGNVSEWCRHAYQERTVGGTDPEATNESASRRVNRGGNWISTFW